MRRRLALALALILALPAIASAQGIQMRQGSVYTYPVPMGWTAHDGTNGVDMQSPDGSSYAYAIAITRQPGVVSPQQFAQFTLQNLGYADVRVAGSGGWQGADGAYYGIDYYAVYHGNRVQGRVIARSTAAYGQTEGEVRGFHTARWQDESQALVTLLDNVKVTNVGGFAAQGNVRLPGNNPLDSTYGRYQASGAERDRVRDKSSQGWQEGMLGRQRATDPQTGRTYNAPLEKWDPTIGGYRNPAPGRGNEVLQHANPGE